MLSWLNLIGNIVIVGTGGAVRLTGSGLGCPTWPQCAADSWIPTQELTSHSVIEFSNRMMSPVLGLLALALVVVAWRVRPVRRDVRILSAVVLGGILAQAIVGGITVLTGLNAAIVGFHFVASAALVGITTALTILIYEPAGERTLSVPRWVAGLTHAMSGVLAVVVVLGVFTTASGPHSGDDTVIRDGTLWQVFVGIHAISAFILMAVTVAIVFAALRLGLPKSYQKPAIALLGVQVVEMIVGITQARLGIPGGLVGIHMVLAAVLVATATATLLRLKIRKPLPA